MKQKPLRVTDIIIASLLFINSLIVGLKFGSSAIGQIVFNIILAILLFSMSFTKDPSEAKQSQSLTLFYITRVSLFILILLLGIICIYNLLDGFKTLLGI